MQLPKLPGQPQSLPVPVCTVVLIQDQTVDFFHKTAPSMSAEPGLHLLENKMLKMFFPIYYLLCIV